MVNLLHREALVLCTVCEKSLQRGGEREGREVCLVLLVCVCAPRAHPDFYTG